MNYYLLFLPFCLYVLYILYQLLIVLKKKQSDTTLKFSKGLHNYAGITIFLTVIATMIGPGFSYGAVDKFKDFGFFFTIFYLLSMAQFWVFGQFFVSKLKSVGEDKETVGDLMGMAYGKVAQITTGVITVFFSVAIVGVIGLGGGLVIASVTDIPADTATIIIVGLISLYAYLGGIEAVIKTDRLQFALIACFIIIGVIACFIHISKNDISLNQLVEFSWNTNNMSISTIIATSIAFFFGEAFLPVYSIRGIIAKNKESAKKSFKNVAYFGVIWFLLLTFIGITANTLSNSDSLSYFVLTKSIFKNNYLGIIILGVALTGMISVVMSTLDSILNTGAVAFRKDIIEQVLQTNDEQKLTYTRVSILILSGLGVLMTMFMNDIVNLLLFAYTIWVPAIIFPLGYFLLKGKVNSKYSGIIGILFGFFAWLITEYVIDYELPAILFGLILNSLAFGICEFISRDKKNEKLGINKE